MKRVVVTALVFLFLGIVGVGYSFSQLQTRWNTITSFTGSSNQTTDYFFAPYGRELRIDEYVWSNSGYSLACYIYGKDNLFYGSDEGYHPAPSNGELVSSSITSFHDSSNGYYLEIKVANVSSYTLVASNDAGLQFSPKAIIILLPSIAVSIASGLILVFPKRKQNSPLPSGKG